ncbi:hypothetical protein ACF3M1_07000 [Luteimonas sp. WGS1318]
MPPGDRSLLPIAHGTLPEGVVDCHLCLPMGACTTIRARTAFV